MKVASSAGIKITGDEYAGFYSCGMTMLQSSTMRRFTRVEEDNTIKYISENGLELNVKTTASPYSDAYEVNTCFTNNSSGTVTLEMMTSFLLPDIRADKLHRIQSFWSAEGRLKTDDLCEINMEHAWNHMAFRVEKFGNVGSMPVRKYFPFVALEDSGTHTFTAVQLYSPASWQIELVVRQGLREETEGEIQESESAAEDRKVKESENQGADETETQNTTESVTLAGGIADRDFGQWMRTVLPGETFDAPKAVVAVGGSLEEVCDKLVKAQHPDISPVDDRMGITFNEYCTTWGNPTAENLKRLADKISGKGIQYLVMDSGWYSDCGNWWEYRGDWSVNKKRFPNGLKEVADYIRERGMIPGIWFEFELAAPKSGLYDDPAHFVKKDGVPLTVGGARFWDMEDPYVEGYLRENVIKTLKDNGFGYIKIDYNDTMGMGCDGPEDDRIKTDRAVCNGTENNSIKPDGAVCNGVEDDSIKPDRAVCNGTENNGKTYNRTENCRAKSDGPGENLRRKVVATQRFFKELRREIPELVIENCSSGGHRLEPSFMELASQASFSDAHEIASLPIIAANLHRVIRPEQSQIWAVLRAKDTDSRIYYSLCATLLGRMGMSGDIYDLNEHQWKLLEDAIAFYRKAAQVIKEGSTVKIISEPGSYNRPQGGQLVVRKLGDTELCVYHRFEKSVPFEEFARKHGLNEYCAKTADTVVYGKAECDFSAEAWMLTGKTCHNK